MSLALYPARVRSSEVLERTRLGSPKPLKSLGTTSLALRAHPWHPIGGLCPKLMRRMPPPTQRRNTAYLNRAIWRFGRLDRSLHAPALKPRPDLRLILMARSSGASERTTSALPTWTNCYRDCAAWSKSEDRTDLHSEGFVRSNGWAERRARRRL